MEVPPKAVHELKSRLYQIVKVLSHDIGTRSYTEITKLNKTIEFIEAELTKHGCSVQRQSFSADRKTYSNLFTTIRGTKRPDQTFVIGAHYDTVSDTPGADDNASGIAGIIELSRLLKENPATHTVCLAAFCLEEPPFFRSELMGSYIFAKYLKERKIGVLGMISLEMIGYFSDMDGSQFYPLPFFRFVYPDKGNFIAFVGNISSRPFTKRFKQTFKKVSPLPVESLNTVSLVPGIDFSDHLSFWRFNYPAFMITDTAFYRNPYYHSPGDSVDTLNYEQMSKLVLGIYNSIKIYKAERR
jgi:Zn-dependent M28 family amino/carboxypeptidase